MWTVKREKPLDYNVLSLVLHITGRDRLFEAVAEYPVEPDSETAAGRPCRHRQAPNLESPLPASTVSYSRATCAAQASAV